MRIRYIVYMRLPTERAHGIQIMQMCAAFVRAGVEVELIVSKRGETAGDPFEFYNIAERFAITRVNVPDFSRIGAFGTVISTVLFTWLAAAYVRRTTRTGDVPYARDPISIYLLRKTLSSSGLWETHMSSARWYMRLCARRIQGPVIAITQGLADFWIKEGLSPKRFLIAPDGFNARAFSNLPDKGTVRNELNLPSDRCVVLYTGHLYDWKGATTLAEAAKELPDIAIVVFVGGTDTDAASFRSRYGEDSHIRIVGHRPHAEVPRWLSAADILVLPNSGKSDLSRLYTSPLKLFEYMATGKVIVASDLPSVREILSEDSAYFARPDDAKDFARVITQAMTEEHSELRAMRAKELSTQYSWDARVQRILAIVKDRS